MKFLGRSRCRKITEKTLEAFWNLAMPLPQTGIGQKNETLVKRIVIEGNAEVAMRRPVRPTLRAPRSFSASYSLVRKGVVSEASS